MRITVFGWKSLLFYLGMAVAYVASPYSNVFFLLVSFLTLQWLLGCYWTLRNMRGVAADIDALEPMPAQAGGSGMATLELASGRRMRLEVTLQLEGGARAMGCRALARDEDRLSLRVPPLPRGVHRIQRAWVGSSFPLGILERRRPIDAPVDLVVYPSPAALAQARGGAEALADALGMGATDGDLQPSGLRDFRPGDSLRAIHWRSSARRSGLVVKEWEGGGGQGLEVLLDRRCSQEDLEQSLSLLAALVGAARENKEVLALHSQSLVATFGDGHRPWKEALRFLAEAQALPLEGPAPPPVSPGVTRLPDALHQELAA